MYPDVFTALGLTPRTTLSGLLIETYSQVPQFEIAEDVQSYSGEVLGKVGSVGFPGGNGQLHGVLQLL